MIQHDIYHMPVFKGSEVQFRADALKKMVVIISNDVHTMINDWNDELLEVKK